MYIKGQRMKSFIYETGLINNLLFHLTHRVILLRNYQLRLCMKLFRITIYKSLLSMFLLWFMPK